MVFRKYRRSRKLLYVILLLIRIQVLLTGDAAISIIISSVLQITADIFCSNCLRLLASNVNYHELHTFEGNATKSIRDSSNTHQMSFKCREYIKKTQVRIKCDRNSWLNFSWIKTTLDSRNFACIAYCKSDKDRCVF